MSFDELSNTEKSQQKLVKNFNEFLNFASINKNRIADKFAPTTQPNLSGNVNNDSGNNIINMKTHSKDKSKTPSPTHAYKSTTAAHTTTHPLVQLTRSGFVSSLDESDSSSVPDTTWSGDTAATAIQQANNASNNSLHMELSSLSSSATHTPDRTPTGERKSEVADGCEKFDNTTPAAVVRPRTPIKNLPAEPSLTPDDSQDQEYYPMTTAITRELRLEAENLDRQVFGDPPLNKQAAVNSDYEYEKLDKDSLDLVEDIKENEIIACPDISELLIRRRSRNSRTRSSIEPLQHVGTSTVWQNADELLNSATDSNSNGTTNSAASPTHNLHNPFIDPATTNLLMCDDITGVVLPSSSSLPEVLVPISTDIISASPPVEYATNAVDEIAFTKTPLSSHGTASERAACSGDGGANLVGPTPPVLPPPTEFGGGNPFLMFLCLTLLLQHRQTIMKSGMDYNEIAMHFDKMVRKHDVTRVLNQARRMYINYLKEQNAYKQRQQQAAGDATGNDINRNSKTNDVTVAQQQQRGGGGTNYARTVTKS